MGEINAVIVDIEGVIRKSENVFHHAYEQALASVNLKLISLPEETWKLRGYKEFNSQKKFLESIYAIAKTKEDLTKILWKKDPVGYLNEIVKKAQPNKEAIEKMEEMYLKYLTTPVIMRRIPPVRAGKKGVKILKEDGYTVAALTNSSREVIEKWLELKHVDTRFDNVMGIEDFGTPKPSPDGILKMCKVLKTKPQNTVYVGDTEVDIIAAKSAGTMAVGINSGGSERRNLKILGATQVFGSVTDFALWLRNGGKL
jgi:HAD superfamily hydrolase (TIGR01549 family)